MVCDSAACSGFNCVGYLRLKREARVMEKKDSYEAVKREDKDY